MGKQSWVMERIVLIVERRLKSKNIELFFWRDINERIFGLMNINHERGIFNEIYRK